MLDYLIIGIAIIFLIAGIVFLFLPHMLPVVEQKLNTPWGEQEIVSIRLGSSSEKLAEKILNRPVLIHSIYWDGWSRKYPAATGLVLCAIALVLLLFVVLG